MVGPPSRILTAEMGPSIEAPFSICSVFCWCAKLYWSAVWAGKYVTQPSIIKVFIVLSFFSFVYLFFKLPVFCILRPLWTSLLYSSLMCVLILLNLLLEKQIDGVYDRVGADIEGVWCFDHWIWSKKSKSCGSYFIHTKWCDTDSDKKNYFARLNSVSESKLLNSVAIDNTDLNQSAHHHTKGTINVVSEKQKKLSMAVDRGHWIRRNFRTAVKYFITLYIYIHLFYTYFIQFKFTVF